MRDEELRALEKRATAGDAEAGELLFWSRSRAGLCVFHGGDPARCDSCAAAKAIEWGEVFQEEPLQSYPPGASPRELEELSSEIARPLDPQEVAEWAADDAKRHGVDHPDRSAWVFPRHPLPPAYLSLLSWSNGPLVTQGERELGFFPADVVRGYMLSYQIPEYMPGALPIAFDGGGTFYLLDLRAPPVAGEYPILFSHAGNLGYEGDSCHVVGASLLEACTGSTDPHKDQHPVPTYPDRVDVWLARRPRDGLSGLIRIKKALNLQASARELKAAFDCAPAPLLRAVSFFPNGVLAVRFNEEGDDCLEVREPGEERAVDLSRLGRPDKS